MVGGPKSAHPHHHPRCTAFGPPTIWPPILAVTGGQKSVLFRQNSLPTTVAPGKHQPSGHLTTAKYINSEWTGALLKVLFTYYVRCQRGGGHSGLNWRVRPSYWFLGFYQGPHACEFCLDIMHPIEYKPETVDLSDNQSSEKSHSSFAFDSASTTHSI